MEGALRKLGVDPESLVVGECSKFDEKDLDEEVEEAIDGGGKSQSRHQGRARRNMFQSPEEDFNTTATTTTSTSIFSDDEAEAEEEDRELGEEQVIFEGLDPLRNLQSRTDRLRRHLGILEEVSFSAHLLSLSSALIF